MRLNLGGTPNKTERTAAFCCWPKWNVGRSSSEAIRIIDEVEKRTLECVNQDAVYTSTILSGPTPPPAYAGPADGGCWVAFTY
jgi:hypothetical protein